jgi:hypothetical protein
MISSPAARPTSLRLADGNRLLKKGSKWLINPKNGPFRWADSRRHTATALSIKALFGIADKTCALHNAGDHHAGAEGDYLCRKPQRFSLPATIW